MKIYLDTNLCDTQEMVNGFRAESHRLCWKESTERQTNTLLVLVFSWDLWTTRR